MNHDMSRYALENGPDETRMVLCAYCNGTGGARNDRVCPRCEGDGEVPADEDGDDQ